MPELLPFYEYAWVSVKLRAPRLVKVLQRSWPASPSQSLLACDVLTVKKTRWVSRLATAIELAQRKS